MRYLYVFKIVVLVLMLVGVIFVIRNISGDKIQKGFDALGIDSTGRGFSPTNRPGTGPAGGEKLPLCKSRIAKIEIRGWKVDEQGGLKKDWVATKEGTRRVLDYIAMEKWLSQSCQIDAVGINPSLAKNSGESILFEFIDGSKFFILLDQKNPHYFKTHGRWVESDHLKESIDSLLQIIGG